LLHAWSLQQAVQASHLACRPGICRGAGGTWAPWCKLGPQTAAGDRSSLGQPMRTQCAGSSHATLAPDPAHRPERCPSQPLTGFDTGHSNAARPESTRDLPLDTQVVATPFEQKATQPAC